MTSRRRSERIEAAIQSENAPVNIIGTTIPTEDTGESIGFNPVGTKKEEARKPEDALSGCLGLGDNLFRYQCSVCNSKTASLRSLLTHRQSVHNIIQRPIKNVDLEPDFNDPNHYCKSCEKHLIGWSAYRTHLRNIHHLSLKSLQRKIQRKSISPGPSGSDYRSSSCESTHQNEHEHRKKYHYMKPRTPKTLGSPDEISDYNNPNFYCAPCDFTYASKKSYIQHNTYIHKVKAPWNSARSTTADLHNSKLYCKLCGLDFKTRKVFKRHNEHIHEHVKLLANSEVKPNTIHPKSYCETCERSYYDESNYKRHILSRLHQVNYSRQT